MRKNHSQTASPNTPTSPESRDLTLEEALLALRFLAERKVLCTRCGYRFGELENQYNLHCTDCKTENMVYGKSNKGSDFERLLCKSLHKFVGDFVSRGGSL